MKKHKPRSQAAITAAGLLAAVLSLGAMGVSRAQDNPPPPAPPASDAGRPLPPSGEGNPGAGPRREHSPLPPGPDADQPPAQPVNPQAAPAAVKTAKGALSQLTVGQVWTRTAPRGELKVEATLLFQGKEVAHLEFDPADGSLRTRGQNPPPLPAGPRAPGDRGPGSAPLPPVPDAPPVATNAPAPVSAAPANLEAIKGKLTEAVKSLSVGQGAEILPREGFWKVPLIYQSRVVGELHLSGDGSKLMQDFAAARDAAVFAR